MLRRKTLIVQGNYSWAVFNNDCKCAASWLLSTFCVCFGVFVAAAAAVPFLPVGCSSLSHGVLCWLDNAACPRARVLQLSAPGQLSSCASLAGWLPEMKNVLLI